MNGPLRPSRSDAGRPGLARMVTWVIFVGTLVQLALPALRPDLPQFQGKAFGTRLVLYPLMMWLAPALWWLFRGRARGASSRAGAGAGAGAVDRVIPWRAFGLVMAPFLIDVTGNTLNLYDAVTWWDDLNHFVNWALLLGGLGLLLDAPQAPRRLRILAVTGLGAILAIVWELGEWWTFIRFGKELDSAYVDTLGDLTLGTCGALLSALILTRTAGRSSEPAGAGRAGAGPAWSERAGVDQ